MSNKKFNLSSEVVLYPGMGGWHFLSVDKKTSKFIKEKFGRYSKGFRSIPVSVTLGKTNWKTSIFPDKKSSTYVLPLKAQVRKEERVYDGDKVKFLISLLD